MKEYFMYLVRLPSTERPTPKSCFGISFSGVGRGGNVLLIGVYAENIEEADHKLRKCLKSIDAQIIPIPFEVAGALQYARVIRARLELDMFCLEKGHEALTKILPEVKSFIGDQITLRSRQAKRLKRLMQKIKKYEDTPDPSLLDSIVKEMYHLGINPEQIEA